MALIKRWKATTALLLTLGMNATTLAPLVAAPFVMPQPAAAQAFSFPDVPSGYWAKEYIDALVARNVLAGFPDGTFRPDAPVTRAQFSSMLQAVYRGNKPTVRNAIGFRDVPSNHWASQSIRTAYELGFLSGYPDSIFLPEQNIPREQVLVALANGLNYRANNPVDQVISGTFNDGYAISDFARPAIAAATEKRMVVNYPSPSTLNPGRNATRAEVAAFLYQALLSEGRVGAIPSAYVASYQQQPGGGMTDYRIAAGTSLPVTYERDQIVLMPDETVPVTFRLSANITTPDGRVLIPAGSQVSGEFRPAGEGRTQFVAQTLVEPNGTQRTLSARSAALATTDTIREGANLSRFLKNTAIGTAAGAAIAAVTGDRVIATEDLLIGAAGGGVLSLIQRFLGRNSVDVVVVQPATGLDLTLDRDLMVAAR
ncbi:MAG: S-layer homology domain-containing protein [Cyanobacteria bacterium]|nr:S-layer homology domain-containing protein [Cyanobacteriota bacterium]